MVGWQDRRFARRHARSANEWAEICDYTERQVVGRSLVRGGERPLPWACVQSWIAAAMFRRRNWPTFSDLALCRIGHCPSTILLAHYRKAARGPMAHRAEDPSQAGAGWRAGAAGRPGNGAAGSARAARRQERGRGSMATPGDHHARAGTLIPEPPGSGTGRPRSAWRERPLPL